MLQFSFADVSFLRGKLADRRASLVVVDEAEKFALIRPELGRNECFKLIFERHQYRGNSGYGGSFRAVAIDS